MGMKSVGAGLATASIAGSGIGAGLIFGNLILSLARNPKLETKLFAYAILGFALVESIALFGLMMAFLLLYTS